MLYFCLSRPPVLLDNPGHRLITRLQAQASPFARSIFTEQKGAFKTRLSIPKP